MPGNETESRIHKLYELDNYSRQSEAVDGNSPVRIYNQWHEKQREIGEPLTFNPKSTLQQLDSVKGHYTESLSFDNNYTQLAQRHVLSDFQTRNQHLKTNGFMLGRQDFQERQNQLEFLGGSTVFASHNLTSRGLSTVQSEQDNASGDSPTLTTNSEKSEITEASTEFDFGGRQQQLARSQKQDIPQLHSMQQSGYNDMQVLQQNMMFKKLQELQRQQQLQQFGDAKQQNPVNQLSAINKQTAGVQFSPLINGTPVNDTPQMFMNWVQRGGSPAGQNVSNRGMFLQEQSLNLSSTGRTSPQFDVSLYGTPVGTGRGNMNQYSHLQPVSHDSNLFFSKASDQTQKPAMQSSVFSNSFAGAACPDQGCLPQGTFISKQGSQGKNMFGQAPVQGLNCGSTFGNIQQGNTLQTNTPVQEFSKKQDQAGWPVTFQEKMMQHGPSEVLVPLDPIEQKILFNTDDNIWEASSERRSDIGVGSFENAFEEAEFSNAFPSLQSGSWSALMQSAVAEASSSDTGQQEEWSGLSFQNTELSTGNQPSGILDSEKQQGSWVDNNLQSASSFSSKPFPSLNDSSVNSNFPGFPQPGIQFKTEHREEIQQDVSHDSIQRSPRNSGEWLNVNPQQQLSGDGGQQILPHFGLENTWTTRINKHSESDPHQQRIDSYGTMRQPSSKAEGDGSEATYKRNSDGYLWKGDGDPRVTSFSRSTGQLEQVQSGSEDTLRNRENSHMFNFSSLENSHMTEFHQETSNQVQDNSKLDYMKHNRPLEHFGPSRFDSLSEGMLQPASNPNQMQTDSDIGGQSSIPHPSTPRSSIAETSSSPTFPRNQLQMQHLLNASVAGPSTQATLPGTSTRHPASNLALSRDTSQQIFVNPGGQQFPVLEAMQVSQPPFNTDRPARGGVSVRSHGLSINNPSQQHLSGLETTALSSEELNSPNTQEGGYRSCAFGAAPLNFQGLVFEENRQGKERSPKTMPPGMLDAPQTGAGHISDPSALASGSPSIHSHMQDFDRIHHVDNNGPDPSASNLGYFSNASKPSLGFNQNYWRLHQPQAMKNADDDQGMRHLDVRQVTAAAGQQSIYGTNKADELNSAARGYSKGRSYLTDAREDSTVKVSSQSAFQAQGMVAFGGSDSQSQSTGNDVLSNYSEVSEANLRTASNMFKHYGIFQNGQMPPMYDAGLASTAPGQVSLVKPSQSMNMHSSVEQIGASGASQSKRVWPGTAVNMVASEPFVAPYLLASDVINESMGIVKPKRRKIETSELLPWHKVIQGSNKVQDISMTDEDWALASNRLIEKVGDAFEMIEDGPPFIRSKKRLISTTRFLQHLLGPAPASILSEDASVYYDTVTYFVAKLSVGDACSLTGSRRKSTCGDSNMILENPDSKSIDDHYFSKIVGDLNNRTTKLENDFLRLDKAASVLDVRLECQELERFSVINRFAKFHIPRADMSGNSSSCTVPATGKPFPQRYVTGQPLPKNLPEGVPCLSL